MNSPTSAPSHRSILIVGASRGLGYAMAAEFAVRGWRVLGTVRAPGTPLHGLAAEQPDLVEIETLDMTDHDQILAVRDRLLGRQFDIVFINGGVVNPSPGDTMAGVSTDDFVHVMVTNVLGVMRAVEAFGVLARPGGVIGVMSSGQGSITNNANGTNDVYRASKAALNQAMSSYAGRHASEVCALVLMAPGWIRTDMGGSNAPFSVEDAMPEIVDALIAQDGAAGLHFLDRNGRTVPW
ncbi:SDR family NAD(P)-dependent oxidoreductase [Phenylobacterium sp.]|jgi:NAD(P)-dependent dehydrogenase (short-subunit alcohol dehydrogenase family)|uniref:SDR family NAD(P)-dependent oxidoreductase n=1 Tax=Phenylobacterium sp. TaxID=1871053 RepID=UPI0012211A24|nr:SDR family NAD(P)-dependent oxidoreductase [Phenylobacterium sp.]THD55996.1 MAG: SDR family NAD(P)-dependent oxidoreductase [Phenylobacterium sp.]